MATPCASLGTACPVGTVLLGQMTMDVHDREKNEWRLQLLLFDVIQLEERNLSKERMCAEKRYQELVKLDQGNMLRLEDREKSIIVLQWAGNMESMVDFEINDGGPCKHIVESFLRLGPTDPCSVQLIYVSREPGEVDWSMEDVEVLEGGVVRWSGA